MNLNYLMGSFGWASLLFAVAAFVAALAGLRPPERTLGSYLFILALMALVSGAIVVAARLRARQHPVAVKAVPSSLVAYLLFFLMAMRWLGE